MTLQEQLGAALAGRYAVEREIGRGGMATVFLAEDLKHKRPVAVKVLNPDLGRMVGPARFLREIEIAAQLTHPHILPVFDSGSADGLLYYVMPFVRGESLRHRLDRGGALPIADAIRIAREVADALDYAHRHGYVHRDIKPENVLLEEGHAFVADFGVGRAVAGDGHTAPKLTEAGIAIGTPYYMSPEQASGDPIDGRTDLYALGCVLYEMLTGKPVFEGQTAQSVARQHLLDTPRSVRAVRADVPVALDTVVARALAKTPAERWNSGAEIAAALESGEVPAYRPPRRRRRWLVLGGVAAAATAALLVLRAVQGDMPMHADLVAVAPFDVLAPELQLWREGLVDVVARNLDGAGSIRVVAPTIAVRRWDGRADAPSARELGRRTGAGLAVYGTLVGMGGDSVRLTATLFDVLAGRPIQEFQVKDVADRMDRVADSLSLGVLRELARRGQAGTAVRLVSVGTGSLPALRAFLRGEQFYRETNWDSAITYYGQAIAQDSTFALPWWRVGTALGWQRSGADSLSRRYHARAGALNHHLSPRDSLLVAADSLTSALYTSGFTTTWRLGRRLFASLDDAVRRYPDDPEIWYALGEARFHFAAAAPNGVTDRATLAAFDRSIALDSAFGPAYIHGVQLALALDGAPAGLHYANAYLALEPTDINAQGIRLVRALLARDPAAAALVDRAPHQQLVHAIASSLGGTDSAEIAVQLARAAAARSGDAGGESMSDRHRLAAVLASRGHITEAVKLADDAPFLAADLMALGAVPAESAEATYRRWVASDWLEGALPRWWAARRDTGALLTFIGRVDSLAQGAPPRREDLRHLDPARLRQQAAFVARAGRIALTLARGDTATALQDLLALPDSACPGCAPVSLITAQLLAARGRLSEAATWLDRLPFCCSWPPGALWALERGRVNERLGRREAAIESYRYVAEIWRHADPVLQPFVEEARAALSRLTGERTRG